MLLKLLNNKNESEKIIKGLKSVRARLSDAGIKSAADVVFNMLKSKKT